MNQEKQKCDNKVLDYFEKGKEDKKEAFVNRPIHTISALSYYDIGVNLLAPSMFKLFISL